MLGRARTIKVQRLGLRSLNTRANTQRARRIGLGATSAAAVVAVSSLWYLRPTIQNEGPVNSASSGSTQSSPIHIEEDESHLNGLVWGSNKSHLLSFDGSEDSIRTPAVAKWLEDVALRDVVLHKSHAACVDARGDVYQWGDGFVDSDKQELPALTLRGKNIISLKATENRIFALSSSGRVYVFSTHASEQIPLAGAPAISSDSWWGTRWLWSEEQTIDVAEITTNESLSRGEKVTSIEAGNDHLLGLTSKGRVFVHPFNDKSNAYGQLGLRKFDIPDPTAKHPHTTKTPARVSVELIPKSISDPYAKSTRLERSTNMSEPVFVGGAAGIRGSDKFFELPSLRGVEVAQIAAGGRSSFARTKAGKVLGWGANEYGQIGLGSNVTLNTITVPTEVILWRTVPGRVSTRCLDIIAGGDLTGFVVERSDGVSVPTYDLLMCGNGQWGGLGCNIYTNSQGEPLRSRNVSGLLEYSDENKRLEAIAPYSVSVSPSGHILLALDTLKRGGPDGGRDLYVWGANHESELGNNKRASLPIPTTLDTDGKAGRLMLGKKDKAGVVKDLKGKIWKKGVEVEQCAVTGWKTSMVYWKIC